MLFPGSVYLRRCGFGALALVHASTLRETACGSRACAVAGSGRRCGRCCPGGEHAGARKHARVSPGQRLGTGRAYNPHPPRGAAGRQDRQRHRAAESAPVRTRRGRLAATDPEARGRRFLDGGRQLRGVHAGVDIRALFDIHADRVGGYGGFRALAPRPTTHSRPARRLPADCRAAAGSCPPGLPGRCLASSVHRPDPARARDPSRSGRTRIPSATRQAGHRSFRCTPRRHGPAG